MCMCSNLCLIHSLTKFVVSMKYTTSIILSKQHEWLKQKTAAAAAAADRTEVIIDHQLPADMISVTNEIKSTKVLMPRWWLQGFVHRATIARALPYLTAYSQTLQLCLLKQNSRSRLCTQKTWDRRLKQKTASRRLRQKTKTEDWDRRLRQKTARSRLCTQKTWDRRLSNTMSICTIWACARLSMM